MISESYDVSEFFRKINPSDTLDLIHAAEQEATSAERSIYHPHRDLGASEGKCREYANALKSLIGYLRYPMHPPVEKRYRTLFQDAQVRLRQRRHGMFDSSL